MSSNGSLTTEIDKIRDEIKVKYLNRIKESVDGSWAAYDAYLNGSDRFPQGRGGDPPAKPSDRDYGRQWPAIRSIVDIQMHISASRMICLENAYAQGILQALVDATVGHGGSFKASDNEIEAYLENWALCYWAGTGDPFADDPLLESNERQCLRRMLRDGDVFIYTPEDDYDKPSFFDPERCIDYGTQSDGWSYGIKNQTEPFFDVSKVEEYSFIMAAGKQTFIPAYEITHVKGDTTDSTVKRSLPHFKYDVLDAFINASSVMTSVSVGAGVRARMAVLWQCNYGDDQDVEGMALTDFARNVTAPIKRRDVDQFFPIGSEVFVPDGQVATSLPIDYSPQQIQAVQGALRMACASFQAPEYLTGDSSNANYASTRESGTPFVRKVEGLQARMRSVAMRLAAKALKYAVANEILTEDQVRKCKFNYTLPAVVVVDQDKKMQGVVNLVSSNILTLEEARMELGWPAKPGNVQ